MKNSISKVGLFAVLISLNALIRPEDPSQIARNLEAREKEFTQNNTGLSSYAQNNQDREYWMAIAPMIEVQERLYHNCHKLDLADKEYQDNRTEANKAALDQAEHSCKKSSEDLIELHYQSHADPSNAKRYTQMKPNELSKAIEELKAQHEVAFNKLKKASEEKQDFKIIKQDQYDFLDIKTKLRQAEEAQNFFNRFKTFIN